MKYFKASLILITLILILMVIRTLILQPQDQTFDGVKTALPQININVAAKNLSDAIRCKTISTADGNIENADGFKDLHKLLRERYPNVFQKLQVQKFGAFGLLLKWQGTGSDQKPMMLMAHQDVVPTSPGSLDKWTHPPFDGVIENGIIYGRGTLDDKGSLIGIFEAVSQLEKDGFKPSRDIYLFFSDDEELLGATAALVAKYFKENDIRLGPVFDEGGYIITDAFPQISSPVALIGISEKGYMDVELSTSDPGGHSSFPKPNTTVGIISKAITALEANPLPPHIEGVQKELLTTVGAYMSFGERFAIANMWLFKPLVAYIMSQDPKKSASIRTTTAATVFHGGSQSNVLPAQAKATVNFRIIPGETINSVLDHVQKVIGDPRVQIAPLKSVNPSPFSDTDNQAYGAISKSIQALFPQQNPIITPYITIGATDSRHFSEVSENQYRFLSCLVNSDELAGFHGIDERLSIENVEKQIQFYMLMIKELA